MTETRAIRIESADLDEEREKGRECILAAGLPSKIAEIDAGRYGGTHIGLDLLETLEESLAIADEVVEQLSFAVTAPETKGFQKPRPLDLEETLFVHLFALYAASVHGSESTLDGTEGIVKTESTFRLGEVRTLAASPNLAERLLEDLWDFVAFHRRSPEPGRRVASAVTLRNCVHAYFELMARTVQAIAGDGGFRRLREALEETSVEILGRSFSGFQWQRAADPSPSGLLRVETDDIVGNEDYLETCLRVARDVAGFDLDSGKNPKTFNPVLFALGRPGCGKTVTAHAVGNYFLGYCEERNVPSRFLVVRRTDWASSYQNASAGSLVSIFTERVAAFPGVCGVYWPDIDTAFAAREDPGIRAEEKNILGAMFGLFDGTLLPKNGKWFLMCDANHLTMDEATVSRITQEPFILSGATTPEQMVRLLRDVKLREHISHLQVDASEWLVLGKTCAELELSGRAIDNIARKIVAEIQSFEYPDEYFSADYETRREIIRRHSRTLCREDLEAVIERYARFEKEGEERAERERFERRVEEIVFNLSAQRKALADVD